MAIASDAVVRALVDALDGDALEALAERLAPRIASRLPANGDGWLDAKAAAAYLGVSVHALHRLSAERRIPCSQDRPGGRDTTLQDSIDVTDRMLARPPTGLCRVPTV